MATSETKVVTDDVRLCYPHFFEVYSNIEGAEPKFSTMFLIPKEDTVTVNKVKAAIKTAATDGQKKFGSKWKIKKNPLRDGDVEKDTEEYKGMYFLNASSKIKPPVFGMDNQKIDDSEQIYGGVYGRISVNFYPFNTAGNMGVGVALNGFKKTKDGDPLSSRGNVLADFLDDDEAALLA